ncbi:c-type cytochrome [Luteimonas sp. e5]
MRNARVLAITVLAGAALAAVAIAQTNVIPLPESTPADTQPIDAAAALAADPVAELAQTHWGDAQAGAGKAGACAACHGLDGNALQQNAPRIAGMPELYVARQLALFKSGQRHTGLADQMKPYADVLSAQDMRDIGAHYAAQRSGIGVADDRPIDDPDSPWHGQPLHELGQSLYRVGDAERGIPACMACHGPSGAGNPGPAYPHIGSQESGYVIRRLEEYRGGQTDIADSTLFQQMATVTRNMSDLDIRAVASYVQGLHDVSDQAPAADVAAAKAEGKAVAPPAVGSAITPAVPAASDTATGTEENGEAG